MVMGKSMRLMVAEVSSDVPRSPARRAADYTKADYGEAPKQ